MQINRVNNFKNIPTKQNFKGNSATSNAFTNFPTYQSVPLETSQAYSLSKIEGYKQLETFNIPYVGTGVLYELSNGHRIAVIPKKGPTTINTFVKAGQEDAPITSHLLEHLIYHHGNKVNSSSFSEELAKYGADSNAATHDNYTEYYINYPFNNSKDINEIIKIQADLLQAPKFSEEKFAKEKNIIFAEYTSNKLKNEIAYNDSLFTDSLLDINRKTQKKDNSKDSINKISFSELIDFYDQNYQNNNMVSVVVGDVKPEEIIKSFSKHFNKKNIINNKKGYEPKVVLPNSITIKKDIDTFYVDEIAVGFVGPKNKDKKDVFLTIAFNTYINDIYENKPEQFLKTTMVSNGSAPEDNLGLKFVGYDRNTKSNEEKINFLNEKISELSNKKFSNDEIEILKSKLKDVNSILFEKGEKISSKVGESLISGNNNINELYKYIDELTAEDLQNYIKKYINPNKQLTMIFYDSRLEEEIKAEKAKENISFTGNNSTNKLDTENIAEYQFKNNLKLIVDSSPEIKRTTFSFELKTNKINEAKPEVVEILKNLIVNTNFKMEENFEPIEIDFDRNGIKAKINTMPENASKAIGIVKKAILSPDLSNENFNKFKYDSDSVQYNDVINLYNEILSDSQGKAVLTIPQKEFLKNKKNIITGINKGIPNLKNNVVINSNQILPSKNIIILETGYSNNASIFQNFEIPFAEHLTTKNKISLDLLGKILGDGNNSMLYKDIRDTQALSYSVHAEHSKTKNNSISLYSEALTDENNQQNIQKILNSYKKNINNLITYPISQDELNDVKMMLKGDFKRKMESSSDRNQLLSDYNVIELKNIYKTIDEITPYDIQKSAQIYLKQPSISTIRANKETLEANKNYLTNIGEVVEG